MLAQQPGDGEEVVHAGRQHRERVEVDAMDALEHLGQALVAREVVGLFEHLGDHLDDERAGPAARVEPMPAGRGRQVGQHRLCQPARRVVLAEVVANDGRNRPLVQEPEHVAEGARAPQGRAALVVGEALHGVADGLLELGRPLARRGVPGEEVAFEQVLEAVLAEQIAVFELFHVTAQVLARGRGPSIEGQHARAHAQLREHAGGHELDHQRVGRLQGEERPAGVDGGALGQLERGAEGLGVGRRNLVVVDGLREDALPLALEHAGLGGGRAEGLVAGLGEPAPQRGLGGLYRGEVLHQVGRRQAAPAQRHERLDVAAEPEPVHRSGVLGAGLAALEGHEAQHLAVGHDAHVGVAGSRIGRQALDVADQLARRGVPVRGTGQAFLIFGHHRAELRVDAAARGDHPPLARGRVGDSMLGQERHQGRFEAGGHGHLRVGLGAGAPERVGGRRVRIDHNGHGGDSGVPRRYVNGIASAQTPVRSMIPGGRLLGNRLKASGRHAFQNHVVFLAPDDRRRVPDRNISRLRSADQTSLCQKTCRRGFDQKRHAHIILVIRANVGLNALLHSPPCLHKT
ncbi:hypothetical protein D3C72_812770 [compost metagenome]